MSADFGYTSLEIQRDHLGVDLVVGAVTVDPDPFQREKRDLRLEAPCKARGGDLYRRLCR